MCVRYGVHRLYRYNRVIFLYVYRIQHQHRSHTRLMYIDTVHTRELMCIHSAGVYAYVYIITAVEYVIH